MTTTSSPFQVRPRLETSDVDEARQRVGSVFCPHRLEPRQGSVHARLHSAQIGSIGMNFLDYGAEVDIVPGDLGDFYLVQIPLAGRAFICQDREEITSTPDTASVLSCGAHVSMRWGATNPQVIFYASRAVMETYVETTLGRPVDVPVRFSLGMDLTTPAGRAFLRAAHYLRDEVDANSPALADPRTVRSLEQLMLGRLLAAQPHSYAESVGAVRPAVSGTVRRGCALIHDHLTETLTPSDVAEALGVSLRSLQEGFRRDLQTSLSSYIRDRRLDRAHRALQNATPSQSVTDIALDLGITHLGRFSVQYKARFGVSPSETLAEP